MVEQAACRGRFVGLAWLALVAPVVLVVGVMVASRPVGAQPLPVPPERDLGARTGLVLQLGLGSSGLVDPYRDLKPVLGARGHALYRVGRYVALGAQLAFGVQHERRATSFSERHTVWEMVAAAELRLTIPIRRFELWLAGMAGYGRIQDDHDTYYAAAWEHGIAAGMGAGGHYFLTDRFALGVDLWFTFIFAQDRCQESYTMADGDVCMRILGGDPPVFWAVGLTAVWFFETGGRR